MTPEEDTLVLHSPDPEATLLKAFKQRVIECIAIYTGLSSLDSDLLRWALALEQVADDLRFQVSRRSQ